MAFISPFGNISKKYLAFLREGAPGGVFLDDVIRKIAKGKINPIKTPFRATASPGPTREITSLKGGRQDRSLSSSNSPPGRTPNSLFEAYIRASDERKTFILLRKGLEILECSVPNELNFTSLKPVWNEARQKHSLLAPTNKNLREYLTSLAGYLGMHSSATDETAFFMDASDIISALYAPNAFRLPFTNPRGADLVTEDGEVGLQLLCNQNPAPEILFEDGAGNGQFLIKATQQFLGQGDSVKAFGIDLSSFNIGISQMLGVSTGLEKTCHFALGNSLIRKAPRQWSGQPSSPHVTFGFRLLPVFNEQKIRTYLKKISQEMASGDLWIGSIALPVGELYEKNQRRAETGEFSTKALRTTFGATTFIHRPEMGNLSDQEAAQALSQSYGLTVLPQELYEVVTNTYMTASQIEQLALQYGLKTTNQKNILCGDGAERLTFALQKL